MKMFIVDAFADRPFTGNPAAVCLLENARDVSWMQSVAAEMNLSETAFVRKTDHGFELRWFAPAVEIDLCGHATLASAHVLWTEGIVSKNQTIPFSTMSGVLNCVKNDNLIELDFPATPASETEASPELIDALGVEPSFIGMTKFDRLVVVDSEQAVRSLNPDFGKLRKTPVRGVIVTSASEDPQFDFVSRFFAPAIGVDEDPVTGSAHCCLGPYWASRLGKSEMTGFQASSRGGIVRVKIDGNRVLLSGQATTIMRGELVSYGASD